MNAAYDYKTKSQCNIVECLGLGHRKCEASVACAVMTESTKY